MNNRTPKPPLTIKQTAHGKLHYEDERFGDDALVCPLPDALDFQDGLDLLTFVEELKAKFPEFEVMRTSDMNDYMVDIRSMNREVSREQFYDSWLQVVRPPSRLGRDDMQDPFRRLVRVRLSGKDRVRPWAGWFHYPMLIDNSRREMQESTERLRSIFDGSEPTARDIIEEAYYEQVMRERLAIFERRREWWRIIRWGSTTALGLVLAAWSLMQIVDRLVGG